MTQETEQCLLIGFPELVELPLQVEAVLYFLLNPKVQTVVTARDLQLVLFSTTRDYGKENKLTAQATKRQKCCFSSYLPPASVDAMNFCRAILAYRNTLVCGYWGAIIKLTLPAQ